MKKIIAISMLALLLIVAGCVKSTGVIKTPEIKTGEPIAEEVQLDSGVTEVSALDADLSVDELDEELADLDPNELDGMDL